jgi:hypothetical protein
MGADYLTDKYTEEGSNANIGGKAPSGALWRCYGCNVRSLGLAGGAHWWIIWWYNSSNERTKK